MSKMADTLNIALPSMRTGQQEMIQTNRGDDGQAAVMQDPDSRAGRGIIFMSEGSYHSEPPTRTLLHEGYEAVEGVLFVAILWT